MNWDDGRLFLAVARAGQLLKAAKRLGVSQATLSRRMTSLERSLGTQLLIRKTNGCELTTDGVELFHSLEKLESGFIDAQARVQDVDKAITGTLRLVAPDGFGTAFVAPRLGDFAQRYPSLTIQLVPVPRNFSLSQREADVAVVVGRPTQGRLVAKKLTDYSLGLYASKSYLANNPKPRTRDDLAKHRLVGYVEDLLYAQALNYSREFWKEWQSDIEISSAVAQVEAVQSGAGIGILHDYLASDRENLVALLPEHKITREYWIAHHASLRDVARVRACTAYLSEIVDQASTLFMVH